LELSELVKKSYYYDKTGMLIQGDCLEIMQKIPDESIDMILCDLPYGTTQNKWDVVIPLDLLWKQYNRIAKNNAAIILTATQPFATELICSNKKDFRYDLIWYKALGTGHLNCNRMPMRNHEHILVFYKKLPVYNPQKETGKMRSKGSLRDNTTTNYGDFKGVVSYNDTYYPQSVIDISNGDRTKENQHPTQKPVALFEYLIKTYTNENNVVLDNAAGSCTTAIACKNLNRKWICIEKEEKYCEISKKRLLEYNKSVIL
jgi:site-specific DNA-methyltransferase (adenine-specific)